MSNRKEKIEEQLRELGAKFLNYENNGSSLITVTDVKLTDSGKNATIFFTVFPDSFEKTALEFAKRKRGEFKQFAIDHSRMGNVPMIDFEIDFGEKNRQRIDEISNQV
jgi:ribosome-binding factor A